MRRSCERSLERLGTDRIDVYQLDNPRMDAIRSDELFATLEDPAREGMRTYGVSLGPKIGWRDEGLRRLAPPDHLADDDPQRPGAGAKGDHHRRRTRGGHRLFEVPHSGMLEASTRPRPPSRRATTAATGRARG